MGNFTLECSYWALPKYAVTGSFLHLVIHFLSPAGECRWFYSFCFAEDAVRLLDLELNFYVTLVPGDVEFSNSELRWPLLLQCCEG